MVHKILKEHSINLDKNKQTPEMCMKAVKLYGRAIKLVHNQIPELCMVAIKERTSALEWINIQTLEICLESVKYHGRSLISVKNQTLEILAMYVVSMELKRINFF